MGETGAGKSTLAKLVARFYDPQRGAVRVDGQDLREVRQASLREQLGVVPQEGFLFSGTVRENILFGRPEASELEVVAATRGVGAHEFVKRLPDGYETEVGERGSLLSAGQRQLIALARAFIADPRILVLDEATANVDVHAEAAIEQGLRRLLSDRTSIVIAHRLSTVMNADSIAVLEGGQVVEIGSHDELIEAGGAYRGSTEAGPSRPPRRPSRSPAGPRSRGYTGAVPAGSSNGRTPGSGPGNRGSSPCPAA